MPPIESHLPTGGKPLDLEVSRLRKTYSVDPIVVDGVVSESPQQTFPARVFGGGYRIHMFSLAAWKVVGGDVRERELSLSRAIPNDSDFQFRLADYSYHRIRVLLSADETRAIVLEGLDSEGCPPDLALAAESLANPVTVEHVRLGSLTLDRGVRLFSGKAKWNGTEVNLTLPAVGNELHAEATRRAEQIFEAERELAEQVSRFLLESVIAEYEGDGLEGVDLRSLLELEGLHFSETGYVEFWYTDGGLWGEHSLVVAIDPDGEMSFSVEG